MTDEYEKRASQCADLQTKSPRPFHDGGASHDETDPRSAAIRTFADFTLAASPDELRLILAIMARLKLGRDAYGPLQLATDRRNWDEELRNELLDAIVYGTIAEMASAENVEGVPV